MIKYSAFCRNYLEVLDLFYSLLIKNNEILEGLLNITDIVMVLNV